MGRIKELIENFKLNQELLGMERSTFNYNIATLKVFFHNLDCELFIDEQSNPFIELMFLDCLLQCEVLHLVPTYQ